MSFLQDRRFQLTFGFFLLVSSLFLFTAFISYLFTGQADQSVIEGEGGIAESGKQIENWLGLLGAQAAHTFIYRWFGVAAFLIPPFLFLAGFKVVFKRELYSPWKASQLVVFFLLWVSLLMGYVLLGSSTETSWSYLSGALGYELATTISGLIGWGTYLLLIFSIIVFVIFYFNVTTMLGLNTKIADGVQDIEKRLGEEVEQITGESASHREQKDETSPFKEETQEPEEEEMVLQVKEEEELPEDEVEFTLDATQPERKNTKEKPEPSFEIEDARERQPEPHIEEKPELQVEEKTEEDPQTDTSTNYDPTLDLPRYQYPDVDLLVNHGASEVRVTKEELEQNKDNILETLTNFKIGITSIKATIGPTVTLYEIVPEPGVKISKIKNLEDDIALSLAALGIRIIAPIPGKGTIGIEVPNKNRETVSMRSVITYEKFMNSTMELPVILGKTISNDVYVTDLAKMPHLLMAGATGQGKSVGLNVLLTSLLYKKHPSQLKFVLVDPKKVELTLFNKVERHFLAKLPDSEDAIITDTKKVVNTLNSLCIEMDNRYELLKDAGCRNIKEYNKKFVSRRLNPEEGHRFLPYIVLVIDELADLMMTAGKEVETPIARLAQLARAIGIHLVVATQRPSVNVITGIIKANFPARLSFRVTQKVDSRTILDAGGAEQLVGMGDMLLSLGSDVVRLQCPFVDTPEVDDICDFIGNQRGYDSAYLLPEFVGDDDSSAKDVDLNERDALFDDAARLIVRHQQGSTSLIQRKLKLGYNRAGRLIDQLEAAGIVGPFEGSKAREVLINDEYSLEQLLSDLDNNA